MTDITTSAPKGKSRFPFPRQSDFEIARNNLAKFKAAEVFWDTYEGNPNPPGEDIDVTEAISDAISERIFETRLTLLLTPTSDAAELHEKLVEIRIGGLTDGHDCWVDVMKRIEADAKLMAGGAK